MREIGLDELPRHSPWPERLATGTPREPRTPASVRREYGRDKHGPLLAAHRADPSLTPAQLKARELGDPTAPTVMSLGGRLYLATAREAFERATAELLARLEPRLAAAASIVDLGCGWGYHLTQVRTPVARLGGDVTPEGVELARRLGLDVGPADLRAGDPGPLARAPAPAVVLLCNVLHQLPTAALAVDALAAHRERIGAVVVFDALAGAQGDGGLAALRRRYVAFNAYSWDLLDVLAARDDVRLDALEPDVVGANALLASSLAVWHFER